MVYLKLLKLLLWRLSKITLVIYIHHCKRLSFKINEAQRIRFAYTAMKQTSKICRIVLSQDEDNGYGNVSDHQGL